MPTDNETFGSMTRRILQERAEARRAQEMALANARMDRELQRQAARQQRSTDDMPTQVYPSGTWTSTTTTPTTSDYVDWFSWPSAYPTTTRSYHRAVEGMTHSPNVVTADDTLQLLRRIKQKIKVGDTLATKYFPSDVYRIDAISDSAWDKIRLELTKISRGTSSIDMSSVGTVTLYTITMSSVSSMIINGLSADRFVEDNKPTPFSEVEELYAEAVYWG